MESTTYLFAMLARGGYYSVLPALAYQRNPYAELLFRALQAPGLSRELRVMTRPLRAQSASAQRLLGIVRETLVAQDMPPGVSLA